MGYRKEWTSNFIRVSHLAKPMGAKRENGPHLYDLREFVKLCEGLPDDAVVYIQNGASGESGRHDVEFYLRVEEKVEQASNDG